MFRGIDGLPPRPGETTFVGEDANSNVWSAILKNVKSQDSAALPSDRNVVVLGDNESGKTTLIAKLQGNEDPRKGSGLEYAFIDVRDEYRDDQTRLNVWILDGEAHYEHLLEFALTEKSVENTMNMGSSMNASMMNKSTILEEVAVTIDGDGSKDDDGDNAADEPLPEGVLARNLGLDLIVVVTKTDYMTHLEKEDYREEHFDFIQQAVRKFCLQYGAALFYTSVKDDKNCDLLYKYLVHRIYGLQFRTPALVVEKDAIFIPSGWDNMKKIAILYENMQAMNPEDYYTDVIAKPATRKIGGSQRDVEVSAEDDQGFLSKHQQAGNVPGAAVTSSTNGPGPTTKPADSRTPMAIQKTGGDRRSSGSVQSTPKKLESGSASMTSEGVLANFFNSLLSKKPPTPSSAGGASTSPATSLRLQDKISTRTDAAAELDRLAAQNKRSLPNIDSPSGPSSSDC
ncbi:unnamed protein product [Notodromas monacha]|uniref:Dynein light intermediate chain n=1 Tax=Notodromas monacha TaxID=399045 RepID=A0A7R9GG79_9CRUS|nr:unnamed protein product [Notodromas monacha]CAG0921423.1 unnamed protein product [Notodromas monacha]